MTTTMAKSEEVDRQAEEVADLHLPLGFAEAGEVAEVEEQRREVGDDEQHGVDHVADGLGAGQVDIAERQVQRVEAGVVEDPGHQREHDDVDGRAAEVDEPADRLHAALEDHQLAEPHDEEADPAEGVEAGEAAVGQRRRGGNEEQDDRRHRLGGEVGLHAVPDDADDAADQRGEVGAHHAERDAGHDREGDAFAQRGAADQVHQEVDDQDADRHGQQDLPAGQAEEEQRGGEGVAADRVDVGHPHGEDRVAGPGALLHRHRGEVLVVEVGVGGDVADVVDRAGQRGGRGSRDVGQVDPPEVRAPVLPGALSRATPCIGVLEQLSKMLHDMCCNMQPGI